METIKLQSQIRQNAEELSSYLSDINKWEQSMSKTKKSAVNNGKIARAPIRESGTIKVRNDDVTGASNAPAESADSHTYDKGYKKWENFDVKAALDDLEVSESLPSTSTAASSSTKHHMNSDSDGITTNKLKLTPASIIPNTTISKPRNVLEEKVPKARGVESSADPEATERERGNDDYKAGNYSAAIKCYTKCLGMKPMNFTAFSNRAMAYLKTKEYSRAEMDCDCALSIEPKHTKSLLRRATARNALGKHRGAMSDLIVLAELEPSNKQCAIDLQKTKDTFKASVNRAPFVDLTAVWETVIETNEAVAGPDMPLEAYID